jgi:hypothetical protein
LIAEKLSLSLLELRCYFSLQAMEGAMPTATRLIQRAGFEPEVMKVLADAFDAEWEAIRPAFRDWREPAVEAARTSLASVAVHLARHGATDPALLRRRLHRIMERSCPGVLEH